MSELEIGYKLATVEMTLTQMQAIIESHSKAIEMLLDEKLGKEQQEKRQE